MKCKYKEISLENLLQLVSESSTYSELMRKLGYTANRGSSGQSLKKYLIENNIDTSHFVGKAHGTSKTEKYTLELLLVKDCTYSNMSRLKDRVLKAGLLPLKCSICGLTEWLNKPIVLLLDHINGDNRDNRIENLRLLCPNCHSLTPTYRGANRGNGRNITWTIKTENESLSES